MYSIKKFSTNLLELTEVRQKYGKAAWSYVDPSNLPHPIATQAPHATSFFVNSVSLVNNIKLITKSHVNVAVVKRCIPMPTPMHDHCKKKV